MWLVGWRLLEVAGRERLCDQVRLVTGVQLVAQIFDVTLDGPRRDAQLLRALLRREAAGDALQHLALTLGQGDEILLLLRQIHHAPLVLGLGSCPANKLSYHRLTAN